MTITTGTSTESNAKVKFEMNMAESHYFISIIEKGSAKKFKIENAFAQFNDQNWASEKINTSVHPIVFANQKLCLS